MRRGFQVAGLAFAAGTLAGLAAVYLYLRIQASGSRDADHPVPFREPPERPAPREPRVPLFSTAVVSGRPEVVDDQRRVLTFRGVSVQAGSPDRVVALGEEGPFRAWRAAGVNAVEVLVPWEALERAPRELDLDQIQYLRWFLDEAGRNGMVVLVTHWMEKVSRCLGGVGAPVFAHRAGLVSDPASSAGCARSEPARWSDLPRRLRWWADFYEGAWAPDDLSLQDHLIWAFVKLAEVIQRHPALLGYDLITGPPCAEQGFWAHFYPAESRCGEALSRFQDRMARALRAVDPDALIVVEDPVDWTESQRSLAEVPGPLQDRLAVMLRFPVSGAAQTADLFETVRDVASLRPEVPLFVALSGDVFRDPALRSRDQHVMLDLEDARVSAFVPAPVARDDLRLPCEFGTFVRPYPMRLAGAPAFWGFDRSEADRMRHDGQPVENRDGFTLEFGRSDALAESQVFIPRRAIYAEDPATEAPEFTVDVSDGTWRWAPWDENVLLWEARQEMPVHRLVVKPWGGRNAPGTGVLECRISAPQSGP